MTANQALKFVRKHGVVLMSARGQVPNLAQAIAGESIRGSWWAHPNAHAIYGLCSAVANSPEVLVCRLIGGRLTLVHRRLWPTLVRLAGRLGKRGLAAVREEHTAQGKHRVKETPFPEWVTKEVLKESKVLTEQQAADALGAELMRHLLMTKRRAT